MTSPLPRLDTRDYLPLVLYGRTAPQILDEILDSISTTLPDYRYLPYTIDAAILEALAVELAEQGAAVDAMPAAVFEGLLLARGLARDPGTRPTTTVTLTAGDLLGHVVPAGSEFTLTSGTDPLVFTLDEDTVIPNGGASNVSPAAATGVDVTSRFNGTAPGTALTVTSPLDYLDTAVTASTVTGGLEPETSAQFLARGSARLRRSNDTLAIPAQFTLAALEQGYVQRANTADSYDPASGNPLTTNAAGGLESTDYGHVTVAVSGPGGAAVSGPDKTALTALLESQALAPIVVHVIDATVTVVPVTVTVRRYNTATDAQVQASVLAALDAFLDPDSWRYDPLVRRNELISVIDQADGVDVVVTLTAPAADVALSGVLPLVDLGALTVTVQPGIR